MAGDRTEPEDLPPDNAARIAIYDALSEADPWQPTGRPTLSEDELFGRVIGRLRILVPRELHLLGERPYFREKVTACIEAGIVEASAGDDARHLALTGVPPKIRYPDGLVRDYEAGLEPARERVEADDARLRQTGFDLNQLVWSLADRQESAEFRALVDSMREHGYMKHCQIVEGADGAVVDGRARIAAAAIAGVNIVKVKGVERLSQRRDSPLHRALLMLDLNRERLSDEDRERVRGAIAQAAGRTWSDIAADLALTQEWRRAKRTYVAKLPVKLVKYRRDDQAKVLLTEDGTRVGIRSLLQAAGLANYKDRTLLEYVHGEKAQSSARPGPPATFVQVADAIAGIETLQRERRKVEPKWEDIRQWLLRTAGVKTRAAGPKSPEAQIDNDEQGEPQPLVDGVVHGQASML